MSSRSNLLSFSRTISLQFSFAHHLAVNFIRYHAAGNRKSRSINFGIKVFVGHNVDDVKIRLHYHTIEQYSAGLAKRSQLTKFDQNVRARYHRNLYMYHLSILRSAIMKWVFVGIFHRIMIFLKIFNRDKNSRTWMNIEKTPLTKGAFYVKSIRLILS